MITPKMSSVGDLVAQCAFGIHARATCPARGCIQSSNWRFPPRNRIIAGLSAAVVVVEAARTGGALITAVKAAEYGIPVFAMPGDVDRASSEGCCNLLIRDGAFPVLDPEDLVEELGLVHELATAGR